MLQHNIRKISSLAQYPLLTRQCNQLKPLEDHIHMQELQKHMINICIY